MRELRREVLGVLIYGRRKTGKTFLIINFLNFGRFFFVNRDSTVRDVRSMELYSSNEFLKVLREILGRESVVIDEFHRLPGSFLDFLHSMGVRGRLVLITSTLWLTKQMLGKRSPLLGLVTPLKIGLVGEREILVELSRELRGRELVEASTYLREVNLILYIWKLKIKPFSKDLFEVLLSHIISYTINRNPIIQFFNSPSF